MFGPKIEKQLKKLPKESRQSCGHFGYGIYGGGVDEL
jgi:mRNA-degrading endonuclease RelE of RelBE toxin-antitoxin system